MTDNNELGLVQVYAGNGKGKTTAALGLAFRAVGHGYKVCIIQFLKGSSYAGELSTCAKLFPYVQIYQFGIGCKYSALIRQGMEKCRGCGECFIKSRGPSREDRELAQKALQFTWEVMQKEECHLLILDEIGNALRYNLVSEDQVLELIEKKPAHMELVLTGRGIPEKIIDAADLVTEMKAIKHPINKGVTSRRGIEY
ncbi:cob(I)yrinic acid a,c-diamide adenosyltransferase [Thermincola ferriacetica]|uniref:Cob(I)yrinic acid a,c-diamide adenosyltransferase n=1 Tax=Thermincola ferriacetica TaxID=281456 RepID=A0A0L6W728_9FIRM|nr:cob(I)yrinic acid a,c-diamide adenosyltransferase [Thermincola ferriacetica]KNZ71188.1 cob(I)yrinic acid a,c-diamide adenosyltransferase [Thermincola ferriacetica]